MERSSGRELRDTLCRAERAGACLALHDGRLARKLRRHVEDLNLISPYRGLYARGAYWEGLSRDKQELHMLRGLAHLHPDWTFCSVSAALVYGFDVPHDVLTQVHVASKRSQNPGKDRRIRTHVCRGSKSYLRAGVRVVGVQEALFGCMRDAPFDCAVAIVDSALRKGLRAKDMASYLESECAHRKGIACARKVLAFADGRSENGGESRARVAMVRLGFAAPDLQVSLPDPMDAARTYRCDFLWILPSGEWIIGELDGSGKYQNEELLGEKTTLDALTDERRRESRLTLYRTPIMRFTFDDVRHPERLEQLMEKFGVPRDETQRERVL